MDFICHTVYPAETKMYILADKMNMNLSYSQLLILISKNFFFKKRRKRIPTTNSLQVTLTYVAFMMCLQLTNFKAQNTWKTIRKEVWIH